MRQLVDCQEECPAQRSAQPFSIAAKWIGRLVGILGLILGPFVHLGLIYKLWSRYDRHVDQRTCTCSCWDTVFKGSYETGISSYKHVYFNSTLNSFKIWIITVIVIIGFYELVKHVVVLICRNQIRWRMCALLISAVYPHYYSWWSYFNYLNDEFYSQWFHQMYFTFTEIASTASVLILANKNRAINLTLLLIIFDVAIAHILVSGFDQLIANVVRGQGNLHQVLRDVGMFLPDIMHLVVAIFDLGRMSTTNRYPAYYLIPNKHFIISVLFIFLSLGVCFNL